MITLTLSLSKDDEPLRTYERKRILGMVGISQRFFKVIEVLDIGSQKVRYAQRSDYNVGNGGIVSIKQYRIIDSLKGLMCCKDSEMPQRQQW